MNTWLAEFWRSWRASLRKPGFLLLASGVLALGIGASATAFNLIDRVLLRPLPLPQPSRLVAMGRLGAGPTALSAEEYAALGALDGVRSQGALAFVTPSLNIQLEGVPQRAVAGYVDHGLLPTLGLRPALGRNFTAREDRPGGPRAVLLTDHFWRGRLAGDPRVVGEAIKVEGMPYTIVGVLPPSFEEAGTGGDIVLPAALPLGGRGDQRIWIAVARLDEGTTRAAVGAQVAARLRAQAAREDAANVDHLRFGATGYGDTLHAQFARVLALFQAGALLVLLVATVNLANLMLLRVLARQHELAVRDALGASPLRRSVPVLAEGLLAGLLGAALGTALAMLGGSLLQTMIPAGVFHGSLQPGVHTMALALLAALLVTLLSAALGLWRVRSFAPAEGMHDDARSGSGRYRGRLARLLVVAQIALTAVLLSASGIFLRRAYVEAHTDWGFSFRDVMTVEFAPVRAVYPDVAAVGALAQRLRDRLRAVPGILDAAVASSLPLGDYFGTFYVGAHPRGGERAGVVEYGVAADYFGLFHIPLQRGRLFDDSDRAGSEPVAIVNRSLADRLYRGQAIGRSIEVDDAVAVGKPWRARIVGVVGDSGRPGRHGHADELYLPLVQTPAALMERFRGEHPMQIAVRVRGNPAGYRQALTDAIAAVAPQQPIARMRSMQAVVAEQSDGSRTGLWICGLFAVLALLLASVGIYAVMAVAVAAREHELGVRSALGASPGKLARSVLRGGVAQLAIGLAVGLPLAVLFPHLLQASFLQLGANTIGAWVIGGVCVLLLVFGLLACLPPAVRAGRVPPMRALRGE